MITTAIFPGRYIQGNKALQLLGEETARLGRHALVILDSFVHQNYQQNISSAFGNVDYTLTIFGGECCDDEINRLNDLVHSCQADVIVGMGGGKAMDTAKAAAHFAQTPVIIIPSLVSTDAPCSALSVIYRDNGEFDRYLPLPRNPDTVLVDTGVIAQAPVRTLVAGMGDAFATWFEAEHCRASQSNNMTGHQGPLSAYALARLCHETLLEYGVLAKESCEQNIVTPALEHIVEANTLLSGIGFESGGLAAAHAIHNGLTVLPECHEALHGEKVAIGIQTMMFLSDQSKATIDMVYDFCLAIGLPVTLAQIGIRELSKIQLRIVAETACAEGETIYNEPYEITTDIVASALKMADAEGHRRLASR